MLKEQIVKWKMSGDYPQILKEGKLCSNVVK
jgi:hypothetical protein